MAEQIRDGTGGGYLVEVGSDNHMHVKAHMEPYDRYINQEFGESYTLYAGVTPTAAADVFMYLKNSDDKDLIITWYRGYAATAEAIDVYFNETGTPSNTAAIPVNLNVGSNKVASGTFGTNADITGLSGGTFADRVRLPAATEVVSNLPSSIIVPKNGVVTFRAVTGAVALEWTIAFHYASE